MTKQMYDAETKNRVVDWVRNHEEANVFSDYQMAINASAHFGINKNTIRTWLINANKPVRVTLGKKRKVFRTYKERQEIINYVLQHKCTLKEAAEKFGCGASSISAWMSKKKVIRTSKAIREPKITLPKVETNGHRKDLKEEVLVEALKTMTGLIQKLL